MPWILTDPGGAAQHQILNCDYSGGSNLIYLGLAAPGSGDGDAAWLIIKFTYDVGNRLLTKRFANGNLDYNQVWTARAGLSYS